MVASETQREWVKFLVMDEIDWLESKVKYPKHIMGIRNVWYNGIYDSTTADLLNSLRLDFYQSTKLLANWKLWNLKKNAWDFSNLPKSKKRTNIKW